MQLNIGLIEKGTIAAVFLGLGMEKKELMYTMVTSTNDSTELSCSCGSALCGVEVI